MKLWQKKDTNLNKEIEKFEVGSDYLLDLNLAPFDVYGNAAHAKMLQSIGILTEEELDVLLKGLNEIMSQIKQDSFEIKIEDEDIHTKVENQLILICGDVGKKIHTARSRNDQVLLDTRLYSKYNLFQLIFQVIELALEMLKFAKKYEFIPMPGYTHMQLAMPSSVGMWASSFVESLKDELISLGASLKINDMNPLGSGAGYGVSIDIDRAMTTTLLGFERIQRNSIYCGNSRGKVESHIMHSISEIALVLNKIASDLLLFTTKEFNFFEIDDAIATGSSIMPQKKNLDVMELMRARVHIILGLEQSMKQIITNVPSGYNRDYQETKKLLMHGFKHIGQMLTITKLVFGYIKPNEKSLIKAHKPELYAADAAYRLVKDGMPFRDAYRKIGNNLEELENEDPYENIKNKNHIGSTGALCLEELEKNFTKKLSKFELQYKTWQSLLDKLL